MRDFCLPVVVDAVPGKEIVPSSDGPAAQCSVSIVFLGERCFIAGLVVNFVSLCEAVCQEDETYELDV